MADMKELKNDMIAAFIFLLMVMVLIYFLGTMERGAARRAAIEHRDHLSRKITTLQAELKAHDEKPEWWRRDE